MLTISKCNGIGGTIKDTPGDFLVEEISENGTVLELDRVYTKEELGFDGDGEDPKKFTTFVLQKRDWNTIQALKTIARRFRRGVKSTSFAGTKDRASVSTQLCSIFGITPEALLGIHIKDLKINGAWQSNDKVKMGSLLGNRFTVTIKDAGETENIENINEELKGLFPNYFGEQRFGVRSNNVQIGLDIIEGDFKGAVEKFLLDTTNERNSDAVEARKRLAEEQDYGKALEYFPQYLKYERTLLDSLANDPANHAKALRKLPRNLTLMFVHSIDSYIFNEEVEKRVKEGSTAPKSGDRLCGAGYYGFPDETREGDDFILGNIIGYESAVNDDEKAILDELGITQEQFKVKGMPELNCRGGRRALFSVYKDFSYSVEKDVKMRFALPSGSYATVFLNEFLKKD